MRASCSRTAGSSTRSPQVTELKEQLRHQAYHDALTGLPNRLLLLEAVERRARERRLEASTRRPLPRPRPLQGRQRHAGVTAPATSCSSQFARRLAGAVRAEDLAARLGGDEFAVLARERRRGGRRAAAAQRMLRRDRRDLLARVRRDRLHASVGIARRRGRHHDAEDLIRNADIAMYSVKATERAVHAVRGGSARAAPRAASSASISRRAIERGEILVHFQPVVSLADGQIEGFEVLARWPHPTAAC